MRSPSPTPLPPPPTFDSNDVPRTRRSQSRREFLRGAWGTPASDRATSDEQFAAGAPAAPPEWTDPRLRLIRRGTMGITAFDADLVRRVGYQSWLQHQVFHEDIDDSAVDAAVAEHYPLLSLPPEKMAGAGQASVQSQLQEATIFRAAFSRRQLYERMVEFWSDHFNISIAKAGHLKAIDDRDVIRKHALGRFSDLLKASAHSPAMLAYLDQNTSHAGSPNQNYARELVELHTLGVDGGYNPTDIEELARVLTGWTYNDAGEFVFRPDLHDFGPKTVLGVTIPASPASTGSAAINEGEQILDVLIGHPSTAKFISTKLLKWLLTPHPTATQVRTIANVWRVTRGDIKLVVRAILNEAWVMGAPRKFKRPFHFLVSALRATQPAVNSLATMNSHVRALGQQLFFYETPDGYPDTEEYWSGNMPARWNFANSLVGLTSQTVVDTAPYLAGSPVDVVDRIQSCFFAGELSATTRQALLTYINGGTFNARRVRETIALALSTAEFQWY